MKALPRQIEARFVRAQGLIDRAESDTKARKARHHLQMVARLLEKAADAVDRLRRRHKIGSDCAAALEGMLTEGKRRAVELAMTP